MSGIAGDMDVVKDASALAARAAAIIAECLKTARAPYRVVLSGGSTPRATYARLAEMDIDWSCAERSKRTTKAWGTPPGSPTRTRTRTPSGPEASTVCSATSRTSSTLCVGSLPSSVVVLRASTSIT